MWWIPREAGRRVHELASRFPAVLVTGARQTGKTSLLRHLYPEARYVTLDLPSAAERAEHDPDALLGEENSAPLVLDEVQYAPGLFRHLKLRIDRARERNGAFLMTGSQKFTLMQGVTESLAGRCALLELDTLSSVELSSLPGFSRSAVTELLFRGGFPALARDPELRPYDFFASYVATYLERDLRQLLRVSSLRDFERLLRACAMRSGQLLNFSDLARDVGISVATAREWVHLLEASNQLVLLEPYFANLGKRLIKAPKLYLRDTGLLCFLLSIDSAEALSRSPFIGAVWKTFVLGELLRAKTAQGSPAAVFFYRDTHGTEVDFAVELNGQVRLIEAKWTELPEPRHLESLRKVQAALGARAEGEHWLVCRTAHAHTLSKEPRLRAINPTAFRGWFG